MGALVFAATVLAGAALAGNGGLAPQPSASPGASSIRDSYFFVAIFAIIVLVGVEGALIVLIVKYRRGKRARYVDGLQLHGSTRLEILWTVVPVLILATIAGFIFIKLPDIANAPAANAADETLIKVEGHQFYWMFHYPNGAISVGTMTAPAGDVVHEDVSAPPTDVLHSWWVPKLGGKIDAVPGRTNHTWFEAPAGVYPARCSDLCGIQHTVMLATVNVVSRDHYEAFIKARAADPIGTGLGKEEWVHVCSTCHKLDENFVGPALGQNPLLKNAKDLSTILRNGVGLMPAVGSNWTDEQIAALVAYTSTLVKGQSNGG